MSAQPAKRPYTKHTDQSAKSNQPADEIIGAMYETPRLCALVPIDIVGMVTKLNPQGLYF